LTDTTAVPPLLLLADDNEIFRGVLARGLQRHGFTVVEAGSTEGAIALAHHRLPRYAVVDLNMPGESGLHLIKVLRALDQTIRIVMLTGYASIATAVEAIKLGATHYLQKPADVAEIVAALDRDAGNAALPVRDQPLSVERLEWEHIQKVLTQHQGNVSATARALNMHRRTLQRKLAKRPVREA
jgi:two-component system, response regulator RegA